MSPSIISFPTILLISSILILTSMPKHIVATPLLIQKACSNDSINIDTELCLRILNSVPSIASARDQFNLSIAIIESGISNSTNTLAHVEEVLNRTIGKSQGKDAFQECKLSYDQVVIRFKSALLEVRSGEFLAPTYDLLTASTDCIKACESALTSQKIKDEVILRGNKIVPIFGISAFTVVADLDQHTSPPPTSNHHS